MTVIIRPMIIETVSGSWKEERGRDRGMVVVWWVGLIFIVLILGASAIRFVVVVLRS